MKGSDYVRVKDVGRMSDYELFGEFLNNVTAEVFINEIDIISQYPHVSNAMIASAEMENAMIESAEIKSMNDISEKHEQRIQIEEGETIIVNLGTDEDKKEIKIGVELSNNES